MRLPRDLSGADLVKRLGRLGYTVSRQTGSHIRLSCIEPPGQHHLTVPAHDPLRIGTLAAVLDAVCRHHSLSREALLARLFD
ncbi:MAG: periplasmic or secreted lipoprotein [Comamonadaceae bacterium BICA1-1]|nr:MAG: periplasmic or secreted lipoprotein [Comamonadaceae bacterium BICA1-1]